MSVTEQQQIVNTLSSDEYARKIVDLCRSEIAVGIIASSMISYYRSKGFPNPDDQLKGFVANKMAYLETIKAIEFKNGKWSATELAKTVLEKYFGL
jgi:hypothetical protein